MHQSCFVKRYHDGKLKLFCSEAQSKQGIITETPPVSSWVHFLGFDIWEGGNSCLSI
jgi:hypothetical protein